MIKHYIFKVLKEQYIKIAATNKEEAYERVDEDASSNLDYDEAIQSIELIDVIDEDVDAEYDDYRVDAYEDEDEWGNDYD